jgi:hypothetical protein
MSNAQRTSVSGIAPQSRLPPIAAGPTPEGAAAANDPNGRADWRRGAIVAIKLAHSAIFLVNSAAILHICWAGLRDRPSRWTGFALAAALGESAVFVANRGRCPLTTLVERLGAENGRVSDIFLPRWFADRVPQLCTPPLVIGVLALLRNRLTRKEPRNA